MFARIGLVFRRVHSHNVSQKYTRCLWQEVKEMPHRRFFPNTLSDFSGNEVIIPNNEIQSTLKDFIARISGGAPASREKKFDGGLYVRNVGISYMYYYLSKFFDHDHNIAAAFEYLQPSLDYAERQSSSRDDVGFLLGNGGIFALACVLYNTIKNADMSKRYYNKYLHGMKYCTKVDFLDCGSDEFLVGRAGYIAGLLWMCREANIIPPLRELHQVCEAACEAGRRYSARTKSRSPLMYAYYGTEYLGAAHGLSAILQMLLTVPEYLERHPRDAADVRASVDFMLSLQQANGNFPCAMDEVGPHLEHLRRPQDELVHWCHGAPGTIYLMARAYVVYGDEKYLKACERCGDLIWEKGLLKKGPGICHGVAGNGYAFLLLHRLTNHPKHLHRAIAFARFLESPEFERDARTPDHPYSLYEGLAGTVCYLVDVLKPNTSMFPFMNVF